MSATVASSVLAENPFLYVTEIPLHQLVVHFAVSLIPLSAIALVTIVFVPKWRGAFLWATLIGLAIGTGAAFISKESGQALADVMGVPQEHSRWGDVLPWLSLLLLAVAIWWAWLSRHAHKQDPMPTISIGSGMQMLAGVIAIVLSVLAFGLTVIVGHTGAQAAWAANSANPNSPSNAPQPVASSTPAPSGSSAAAAGYTLADVQQHSTPQDCWSMVNGQVYDLTSWISQHPGGPGVIEAMCGKDGTAAYQGKHGNSASAGAALASLAVPPPGGGAVPASSAAAAASPGASAAVSSSTGAITIADVEQHATPQDCWSVVDGKVYDLTQWIPQHPGGAGVIEAMCGVDGTDMYNSQHAGSSEIAGILASFEVGTLG
jgi:cytochrome b involved in lipid metabolism